MTRPTIARLAAVLAATLSGGLCACGDVERTAGTADPTIAAASGPLVWTGVASRADLEARLASAKREGRPVVVAVWASWCRYCRIHDERIERSPEVSRLFERCLLLRIDVSEDDRSDLRDLVGIPRETQPFLAFVSARGRVRRELDVDRYFEDRTEAELGDRLRALLSE